MLIERSPWIFPLCSPCWVRVSWLPTDFLPHAFGLIALGVLVALGRMSRVKPLAWLIRLYISVMRGTPLMLQMFFIYFAPYYLFGMDLSTDSKFNATIVAFIINYAAYFAEIYRSGIQSIPRGQYEAAEVLGYCACRRL